MIAEVMRANGAEGYEADLIEKELPRLNRLAGRCVESREDSPAASKPVGEKANEITADIGAKISAQFMGQMKDLSTMNRQEVNETLKKIREDINNVRVAVLEKATDVFCPDTLKNNHRLEMSDRASQTTMDAQLPPTPVQQHRVSEQYSAVRSVKEPDSTAKEDLARQIPPHDPNINVAWRTPALPHDQETDPARQSPTLNLQAENSSPRTPSVLHEQGTTGSAKQTSTIICRDCNQSFHNLSSLYRHLQLGCHTKPFSPPPIGPKSATGSSTKPRAQPQSQRKTNPDDSSYPSLYRPSNKTTEPDRGPPQMDGARDSADPAAQLLVPETQNFENRVSHGYVCEVCYESFESKKLLHRHLKEEGHLRRRVPQKDDPSKIPSKLKMSKKGLETKDCA